MSVSSSPSTRIRATDTIAATVATSLLCGVAVGEIVTTTSLCVWEKEARRSAGTLERWGTVTP